MKIKNISKTIGAIVFALAIGFGSGLIINSPKSMVERISADFGGSVSEYISKYTEFQQLNKQIKIEDVCISACTLVTSLVPPDRVCAQPWSLLGFHSAWIMTMAGPMFSFEGTRLMWNFYPVKVQELLKEKGWDGSKDEPHPSLVYLKGTDVFKECKNG